MGRGNLRKLAGIKSYLIEVVNKWNSNYRKVRTFYQLFEMPSSPRATSSKQTIQNIVIFFKGAVLIFFNFANYSPSIAMEVKVRKEITCK